MAQTAIPPMSVDEFLLWQQEQEDRYELVEGYPVKLMTGASEFHDAIVTNVIIALGNQVRGSPCRPTTADLAVRTKIRSIRRPDETVTCDEPRKGSYQARNPRFIVEVLSPSNVGMGWQRKLEEYRHLDGLAYILLIDSQAVQATLITRSGEAWSHEDFDGRDGVIEPPAIACRLTMTDIYSGLTF
jgi:Uma2 family endonuclease